MIEGLSVRNFIVFSGNLFLQVRHGYFATVLRSLGEDKMILVFTSTCKSCEELAIMVRELGIRCQALHGQV